MKLWKLLCSCQKADFMTPHQLQTLSPIVLRFAQDLQIRNLAQKTIDAYCYHVNHFEKFIAPISLQDATPEHIRDFQLNLIKVRKLGYSSFNQAVCGLRSFYKITLRRNWHLQMIPYGKRPRTLPTVLGYQQVEKLLQCTPNLKHRTLLTTLFATGIRISEATNIRIQHIDSERMLMNIACGKGKKQRYVPLSPRLLGALRQYWKEYRPPTLLFPGKTPDTRYAHTTIQKTVRRSARAAGIKKKVTPHTLRHSYATCLLEAGVDLLTISRLLGHSSFLTTMKYLHCRRPHLLSSPSPLDWLPTKQLPAWQQQAPDNSNDPR